MIAQQTSVWSCLSMIQQRSQGKITSQKWKKKSLYKDSTLVWRIGVKCFNEEDHLSWVAEYFMATLY
jgi:hypothetical protein